jgi:hypothetical protein
MAKVPMWSPGLVQLGSGLRVRTYRQALVPNRCARGYAAFFEVADGSRGVIR